MQAAEAHEAQVLAELRMMEDVVAERDQLSAQVCVFVCDLVVLVLFSFGLLC